MILRRLAQAIRGQAWFTVFIELVIVVVGIVVGIEVANWNEERLERRQEQVYLERLRADMDAAIADVTRSRDSQREWRTQAHRTLFALVNNDPEAIEDSGFELQASTRISLAEPQMATLDELISAGRLGIISDPALRMALSHLHARVRNLDGHNRILVPYGAANAVIIQTRLVPVDGGVVEPLGNSPYLKVRYDFETLAADTEFQNALGFALRLQLANDAWLSQIIEEMIGVRDLLGDRLAVDSPGPDDDSS